MPRVARLGILVRIHGHLVEGAEARLLVVFGGLRWGRAGVPVGLHGQRLLYGLLEQRLQVGVGASGRWRVLRLGRWRFARGDPLRGASFAGFDDFLQGGGGWP